MAVPKQHDSKSKVGKRRSQKRLKKLNVVPCKECKAPIRPHRMCPHCGYRPIAKKSDQQVILPKTTSDSVEVEEPKTDPSQEEPKKDIKETKEEVPEKAEEKEAGDQK